MWMAKLEIAPRARKLPAADLDVTRWLIPRQIPHRYQNNDPSHAAPLGSIRIGSPPSILSANRLRLQLRIGLSMISWRGMNFMIDALSDVFIGKSRRRP